MSIFFRIPCLFLCGCLLFGEILCGFESARAEGNESRPMKLGALLHLTGDLAPQGAALRRGIELAADEINAARGPDDPSLEVIYEDTALKSEIAFKAGKKLLEVDNVQAALVATSAETKAAGTIFERRKVPLVCLWDSSPIIEQIGDYVFGIGTWTPSVGETVAKYMYTTLGIRRAAVINSVDEWSLEVSKSF